MQSDQGVNFERALLCGGDSRPAVLRSAPLAVAPLDPPLAERSSSGGSGLGLAIVKHIVDAHNEKLYVESDYGVGSEFSFTLEKSN